MSEPCEPWWKDCVLEIDATMQSKVLVGGVAPVLIRRIEASLKAAFMAADRHTKNKARDTRQA